MKINTTSGLWSYSSLFHLAPKSSPHGGHLLTTYHRQRLTRRRHGVIQSIWRWCVVCLPGHGVAEYSNRGACTPAASSQVEWGEPSPWSQSVWWERLAQWAHEHWLSATVVVKQQKYRKGGEDSRAPLSLYSSITTKYMYSSSMSQHMQPFRQNAHSRT